MRNVSSLVLVFFILGLCPAAGVSAQDAAGRRTGIPGVSPTDDATNLMRSGTADIIFAASPTLLILIDGDPVYRAVDGTTLQRIVNTTPLIVRDETGSHYLRILDGWMETYSLHDWWSVAGVPPEGADIALRQAVAAKSVDLLDGSNGQRPGNKPVLRNATAPAICISTRPATLIVTDGPPRFAAVAGTSLEYLENTTAKVFREPTDQELYVLVSGRWFRSWTTEGPWQFIPSDQLPADLAKIPESRLKSSPRGLSGG